MREPKTLEEAIRKIEKLEKENADLRVELEYFKKRKASGRQRHNAKWTAIYNDVVLGLEEGLSLEEIAERNAISKRSAYRYKAYYEAQKKEGN